MRLLFIRHGDPDYSIDSLTEKGHREAKYLAERLSKIDAKAYYVSPLGRAKDTAAYTLKQIGRNAVECEWLREFAPAIERPDAPGEKRIAWDWLPQDWLREERFLDIDCWHEPEVFQDAKVKEEYEWVTCSFDEVLSSHGYRRDGLIYRTEKPNNDTVMFFCHFGVTCVLLAHLLHISPMVLWHGICSAPTSVTTVVTEERRQGIASFRMSAFGDISHLYVKDEAPAFAARFCECYENEEERHD